MILRLGYQIAIYLDILNLVVFVYVHICHSFIYRCFCHYCNLYIPFFSHIHVKYTNEISKQISKHNSILRNICDNIFKSMTSDCWASNLSYWINNIIYKYQNKVELRQRGKIAKPKYHLIYIYFVIKVIKIKRILLFRWALYSSLNKLYIELFSKWNIKSSKKKNLFCCSCSLFIIQTWFVPILTSCFIQNKGLNLLYNETRKHMMHSLDAREFTLG